MKPKTIKQLSELLRQKKISSVDITKEYLQKISTLNPKLNCYITVLEKEAIQQAELADKKLSENASDNTLLTGIPIAHKDIFCMRGVKTTCGSKMLDNFISPYNSTVCEKLEKAGIVSLGKTNMDEFAMGSSNETSYYGAVSNPWKTSHVPGGSSGGSAAAISADLAAGATGTDTGGSIRQPAALCGITGLKPTYGRISRFGMIAFASSLDQAGPITHTAEDSAIMLSHMAGYDPKDATSVEKPTENYHEQLNKKSNKLRIGLPKEYFDLIENEAIQSALEEVKKHFERQGHTIKKVSLPSTTYAIPTYYVLASAECSSNLSRYDGIRYGYRSKQDSSLEALYEHTRSEGFGKEVKRRILTGTFALSEGFYDAYYLKAQKVRRLLLNEFTNVFSEVDLLLTPTTLGVSFPKDSLIQNPIDMYKQDMLTVPASLSGLPAISFPCGQYEGLPIGAQLIASHFSETLLLQTAHAFQLATDWHLQHPTL